MEKLVGNLRLLCSHVLDLIGCMHLSLGLSRSNATKNNGLKNHYKINIQKKKCSYLDLDVPKSIPCDEEHA